MIKPYKVLYYRFYAILDKMHGGADNPEMTAILAVTTHSFFNILSILLILCIIFGNPMLNYINVIFDKLNIISRILILILYLLIHIFAYMRNSNFLSIIEEYKRETEENKKKGYKHIVYYVIITIVVFISSIFLTAARVRGDL